VCEAFFESDPDDMTHYKKQEEVIGDGKVYAGDELIGTGTYRLRVRIESLPAGSEHLEGVREIDGSITGHDWSALIPEDNEDEPLRLELSDGRSLKFFFTDEIEGLVMGASDFY
jgi:hypothetical protein